MAKRKRLTPARLDSAPVLETKSASPRDPIRPPIADVAHDAASSAALTEVAQELTDARQNGRLIQRLPLDAIVDDHLERDRLLSAIDTDEMASLIDSIRDRGQQTAIEVSALPDGRYGLISGLRRLTALREIAEIDTVLALVRAPDDAADAYQAMVEENEIRTGLSFFERGRIVMRAVDRGVYRADKVALHHLFKSVPRAKRSKINSFVTVARALDGYLRFPTAMTEKLGLAVAKAIAEDSKVIVRLHVALAGSPASDAATEAAIIAKAIADPSEKPKTSKPVRVEMRRGLYLTEQPGGKIMLDGEFLKDRAAVGRLKDLLKTPF